MRLAKLVFIALCAVFLAACGSNEPKDVALSFEKAMIDGDVKKVMSQLYLVKKGDTPLTDADKQAIEGKLMMMTGEVKNKTQARGGFDKVEFIEETVGENEAQVKVRLHFKDGSTSDDKVYLIKNDGKWQVNLKY